MDSESTPVISRRNALRWLTMGGFGLLAGGSLETLEAASSNTYWSSNPRVQQRAQQLKIPIEWVDQLGPDVIEYATFLSRLRLRGITTAQVIRPHLNTKGGVSNTLPPRSMWNNIRHTLLVVDRVALVLREPLKEVTSAYRSPAYNSACRSAARDSMHMRNNALDIQFTSAPGRVAEVLGAMRNRSMFKGGVGRYGSFTHVDTRGENVSW